MTENRPYEETICIEIYKTLIGRVWGSGPAIDFEKLKRNSRCLGRECQMYSPNFKGCGLRSK